MVCYCILANKRAACGKGKKNEGRKKERNNTPFFFFPALSAVGQVGSVKKKREGAHLLHNA